MVTHGPKHILVAPLDWGLGHTTRCVPIIRHIQRMGHTPIVAGNAAQRSFVERSAPGVETVELEGYNVRYSKWNRWAQAGLLAQLPSIAGAITNEHQWLRRLAGERRIDGVISDNRYGLHHNDIPSVILTHQLRVLTGMGGAADRTLQHVHYKYLNRFGATWVVDMPGADNMSGKLAHTGHPPANASYIGLLSRFEEMPMSAEAAGDEPLILISGPEPQRGELESLLWRQVTAYTGKVTFVAGSDAAARPDHIPANATYHGRLAGEALEQALARAAIVVCRSGYSTLMDLRALGKKAIVIPTPGQTEQEYLGELLHAKRICYRATQKEFDLDKTLRAAALFSFEPYPSTASFTLYRSVLDAWIGGL